MSALASRHSTTITISIIMTSFYLFAGSGNAELGNILAKWGMITESFEPFLPCTGRLTPLGGATRLPCLYCGWPTDVLSSSCEGCLMASRRQPRLKKRSPFTAEEQRLEANARRENHWKRWGPYGAERAGGTVREDYSASGTAWEAFPHEHARSRAYRWNEDGLAGL